ncbi:MAG: hypothetical protein ACI4KG_06465 [Oscillospiraceae bacterium]
MNNNSIQQAEQRVKEMNRMTRQYAEQGNRFMRQTQNNYSAKQQQPRFEPVRRENTYGSHNSQNISYGQLPPQMSAERAARSVPQQKNIPQQKNTPKTQESFFPDLSNIKLDNEKLMILLIMYILIKEKADIKLILALGYLIL